MADARIELVLFDCEAYDAFAEALGRKKNQAAGPE